MLVEAQVSSMNTSRSGSRCSWPSNQAPRRLRTSGRSCSAACAVFFTRDPVPAAKAPERTDTDLRPLLGQARLQLGQGDVGNLGQRRVDQIGMRLGSTREPITPLRLWPGIAASPALGLPADRAGRAHAKPGSGLTAGQARVDGGQNTRAKVRGQRLGHTGRPPWPAATLNQIGPALQTQTDSISANTALVLQLHL